MLVRWLPRALALLLATSCAPNAARPRDPASGAGAAGAHKSLDAARELDQAGVRLFKEGRYADAERHFGAAYRLGGPSSELWNVARCRERLDDAEGAARALEEYLAQRDLAPGDRTEAEREAGALRARPSLLTVTTTPSGAAVTVDGKPIGEPTPVSVEVAAGSHSLTVRRDGYSTETRPLEARFGRAVIVSLELAREGR